MSVATHRLGSSSLPLPGEARAGHQIFLSYCRADLAVVGRLKFLLEQEGFSVWMDLEEIHAGNWRRKIVESGIAPCRVFLLAVSQRSANSPEVQQEINLAREEKKHILPIFLEPKKDLKLPGDVKYILAGLQHFSFGPEVRLLPQGVSDALQAFGVEPANRRPLHENLSQATVLKRCERLSWLIDREGQTNRFKDVCRTYALASPQKRKPLLFYLHGEESTAISEYRESLTRFYLPQILGTAESDLAFYDIVLQEMNLDRGSQDEWLMRIADLLPRHVPVSREGIAGHLSKHPCAVLSFYAGTGTMKTGDWKRFLVEFAKFWDAFPAIGANHLIVKLTLEYTGQAPRVERALKQWLEDQCKRKDQRRWTNLPEIARVLPYLDRIKLVEAKRWLHLAEVKGLLQTIHLRPPEAESRLDQIFHQNGDPIRMSVLSKFMEHSLIDHYRSQHR